MILMKIPDKIKAELKKPLGELEKDFRQIKKLSHSHRIIAVGDVCTLGLLAMGIKPHLAVFDYRFMRKKLDSGMVSILHLYFPKPKKSTPWRMRYSSNETCFHKTQSLRYRYQK